MDVAPAKLNPEPVPVVLKNPAGATDVAAVDAAVVVVPPRSENPPVVPAAGAPNVGAVDVPTNAASVGVDCWVVVAPGVAPNWKLAVGGVTPVVVGVDVPNDSGCDEAKPAPKEGAGLAWFPNDKLGAGDPNAGAGVEDAAPKDGVTAAPNAAVEVGVLPKVGAGVEAAPNPGVADAPNVGAGVDAAPKAVACGVLAPKAGGWAAAAPKDGAGVDVAPKAGGAPCAVFPKENGAAPAAAPNPP